MQGPKEFRRVRIVCALATAVGSLALPSCADELTRPVTASGLTTPPSTSANDRPPVLAAAAAPPPFVFVSTGGGGVLGHNFKCDEASASVTHRVGFVRRSTGPASISQSYQLQVTNGDHTPIALTVGIQVYVLGPPGTRYHVDRFLSSTASASLSPPVSGYDGAHAGAPWASMADVRGSAGSATQSSSVRHSFDGVSGSPTIPCYGTTYSPATSSAWILSATVWDFGASSDSVRGSAYVSLQWSYSGYIPGSTPVPSDGDGDGVPDSIDQCAGTPAGAAVDAFGCSQVQVDSDRDGVCNPGVSSSLCTGSDICPGTPAGTAVDANGCPLLTQVTISMKVFIPQEINFPVFVFPLVSPAPPPYTGKTILEGPFPQYLFANSKYLTDNRYFDPDPQAISRMHSMITIDVPSAQVIGDPNGTHWADPTVRFDYRPSLTQRRLVLQATCITTAPLRAQFSSLRNASGVLSIDLTAAGNVPCPPFEPILGTGTVPGPDIDYRGTISINPDSRTVSFSGFVDEFPAFEMYATVNGVTKSIFLRPPGVYQTPWNLMGSANVPVSGTATF
jgi:hypothetical protein